MEAIINSQPNSQTHPLNLLMQLFYFSQHTLLNFFRIPLGFLIQSTWQHSDLAPSTCFKNGRHPNLLNTFVIILTMTLRYTCNFKFQKIKQKHTIFRQTSEELVNSKIRLLQIFNLKYKTPHSILFTQTTGWTTFIEKIFSKIYYKSKFICNTYEYPETY